MKPRSAAIGPISCSTPPLRSKPLFRVQLLKITCDGHQTITTVIDALIQENLPKKVVSLKQ
jgi:hypothetical protein